jgi:hypothetical protein
MNKRIMNLSVLSALCVALVAPFLTGCKGDDDPIEPYVPSEYLYVLNNGRFESNNASLTLYDVEKGTATQNFFEAQNKGRRLGDTGQDIIVYGSKMYIAMFGESTIEVTDLEAVSLKQIKTEGQPRFFAAHGGKVYVTYYNGYVARIDTSSLAVEAKTQVGRNPEQLTVASGKLFVANSGGLDFNTEIGHDKTVSVIDIAKFAETQKIQVVDNPCDVIFDKSNHIYVVSNGNYMDIPGELQKINVTTGEVTKVTAFNATYMATVGTKLYAIHSQYDSFWNQVINFYSYDLATNAVLSTNFVGTTKIDFPYKVNSDEASGEVYITASDWINDGDVYIFNKSNQFVTKFETGLNPMKVIRILR